MKEKQFNQFWEIKCPKCNASIDIEIILNQIINDSSEKPKK